MHWLTVVLLAVVPVLFVALLSPIVTLARRRWRRRGLDSVGRLHRRGWSRGADGFLRGQLPGTIRVYRGETGFHLGVGGLPTWIEAEGSQTRGVADGLTLPLDTLLPDLAPIRRVLSRGGWIAGGEARIHEEDEERVEAASVALVQLAEALRDLPDPRARVVRQLVDAGQVPALDALRFLGAQGHRDALEAHLGHEDPLVRLYCAVTLGHDPTLLSLAEGATQSDAVVGAIRALAARGGADWPGVLARRIVHLRSPPMLLLARECPTALDALALALRAAPSTADAAAVDALRQGGHADWEEVLTGALGAVTDIPADLQALVTDHGGARSAEALAAGLERGAWRHPDAAVFALTTIRARLGVTQSGEVSIVAAGDVSLAPGGKVAVVE